MQGNLKNTEYESLIIRYLHGEADDKEKNILLEWLKESPRHVQEFNQIRLVAEALLEDKNAPSFDIEKAIARFEERLDSSEKTTKIKVVRPKNSRRIWLAISSVAAAAAIFVGMFFGVFQEKDMLVLAQSTTQRLELKLDDGTIVSLSPNSKIEASENFGKTNRRITLKGEVFFKVKHDAKNPLIIEVNKVIITDIGTAFNVRVDSTSGNVNVQVKEGVVKIQADKNEKTLYPGDFAIVDGKNKSIQIKTPSKEITIEKNATKLIFKDTPLDVVIIHLNKKLNVKFVIKSDQLHTLKLNATIEEDATLDQVKDLLCLALNINIVPDNDKLLMYSLNDK